MQRITCKCGHNFFLAEGTTYAECQCGEVVIGSRRRKGLGDWIERLLAPLRIKQAYKRVTGRDCGCDKRRDKLNKWSAKVMEGFKGKG